jgi:predicted nucleotidyltransferase
MRGAVCACEIRSLPPPRPDGDQWRGYDNETSHQKQSYPAGGPERSAPECLLQKHAVRRIALFGSYAAGSQSRKSDLDFLVDFERPTYDNLLGLSKDLERLFGRKVDILTPQGLESIRVKSIAESIRKTLVYV